MMIGISFSFPDSFSARGWPACRSSRHRLESGPGLEGGKGYDRRRQYAQDQRLQHQGQQGHAPLPPLQGQQHQKGQGDGGRGAHAEGQKEAQGVYIQDDRLDGPLLAALR